MAETRLGVSWLMPNRLNSSTGTTVVLALLLITACGPDSGEPTTTSTTRIPTTTAEPVTTTTSSLPTTTQAQGDTIAVLLYPFAEMGPEWEQQVLPYGDTEDTLGTAPGGENLMLGPDYGTQTADGTWWIFDKAKQRIARFDLDGVFRDAMAIPGHVLQNGQFFQFQMPQAMDDGSIVATGFRGPESTAVLRIGDDAFTSENVDVGISWVNTDGQLLYGIRFEDRVAHSLDPLTAQVQVVEWLTARDGSRYLVTVVEDEIIVELPDVGVTKTLQMRFSEDVNIPARAGIEVETDSEGSIHILFYGAPDSDESLGVGGILSISPDGQVGEMEPITSPFSNSDPGSPAHLGVRPGTSTVWMMVIGEDGVHIHTKTETQT